MDEHPIFYTIRSFAHTIKVVNNAIKRETKLDADFDTILTDDEQQGQVEF